MAEPEAVRASLCELAGVGPKVADCVALFSLDQAGAIPVDTHVWDIACRDFDPSLTNCGSLTPKVYARVGELFRTNYGAHAGWAHSVLFAAELPAYRSLLPQATQDEQASFLAARKAARQQEKLDRAEAKAAGRPYKRPAEPAESGVAKRTKEIVDDEPATVTTTDSRRRRGKGAPLRRRRQEASQDREDVD